MNLKINSSPVKAMVNAGAKCPPEVGAATINASMIPMEYEIAMFKIPPHLCAVNRISEEDGDQTSLT
jgi:hypothetical protein